MIKTESFEIEYKLLVSLSLIKAIYLIVIAIMMLSRGDFAPFRQWARFFGYGDIYFVYDLIPRVQIYGNALLVSSFIINYHKKKWCFENIILLLGVLVAGNFSFIISVVLVILYEFFRNKTSGITIERVLSFFIIVAVFLAFLFYGGSEMARKANTGNMFKKQQIAILLDTGLLFGRGIGAIVERNTELGRSPFDYYYEMQAFYILYQIGLIGIIMHFVVSFRMCCVINKKSFILYLMYLVFSFFNPYCFDSTQLITIIVLTNLEESSLPNDCCNYYYL